MLTQLQRHELKGVADVAFKMAGGNQACATVSRIDRVATFSDYINIEIDNRAVPLDVAIDIDAWNLSRKGGRAWLIEAAARLLGFTLVRVPDVRRDGDTVATLLASAKETTEAIAAGWAAHGDGVVTRAERAHTVQQVDEAIVALLEFRAALEAGDADGQ